MISQKCSNEYAQWAMVWQKVDAHRISQFKVSVKNFFVFIHIPVKYHERLSWVKSLPNINSRGWNKNALAGKILNNQLAVGMSVRDQRVLSGALLRYKGDPKAIQTKQYSVACCRQDCKGGKQWKMRPILATNGFHFHLHRDKANFRYSCGQKFSYESHKG